MEIYTDGSCADNPGPGGWAAFSPQLGSIGGNLERTTNNEAELVAIEEASYWAQLAYPSEEIIIYSDSRWVVDSVAGKSRLGKVYRERVALLSERLKRSCIYLVWVRKGSHVNNVIADKLARVEMRKARDVSTISSR